MDTRNSAAGYSLQCDPSSHPLPFTHSGACPASHPCVITALNTEDSASAVDEDSNRASPTHPPVCTLEYLRERRQTPGSDCEPAPVSEVAEDGSDFLRVFQLVVASQPLLCRLCGPDCCPRAHALKDDQLRPGLCPLDAKSTGLPLPSWSSEAFPDIAKCSRGGKIILLENHWVRANNRLIIPKTSRPFSWTEGRDREGCRKLQAKGRVIWREEAKPGQMCVCLDSKGGLIRGHFLTEQLITDSGIIAPKLPFCHCSLQQLPFEICFCFLPSLKRLVSEVTKINGY